MHESIKQLLILQERDLEIDRLYNESEKVPKDIGAIKKQMADEKAALEDSKKELTHVQGERKEKEAALSAKEELVRKHSAELNGLKSNEAYRAMIGEIDKAKQDRSLLEDEILQLMDKVDQAQRTWRERETAAKSVEGERQKAISDLEAKQKSLEEQIVQKQKERDELATGYPKPIMQRYQTLRQGKRISVVVPIKAEQCSGCHMKLSPNLINEVKRGQMVMFCEHCSRIVYLEEVVAKPS